jgi:hydrogenase maturation protease
MCLSYPAQVLSVQETDALVRGEHRDYRASTLLVPEVAPGDYVIVGAGIILERLEPSEAAEIRELLDSARGEAASTEHGSVLVIGVGNELRADDGVGRAVVARLADDPRLEGCRLESMHQLTPEIAPDAATASLVVFVDATAELAPGEVRVAPAERVRHAPAFSHHVTPGTLMALADSLYGASPEALVVGVGMGSLEPGGPLSPAVESAIPRAAELVVGLVADRTGRAGGGR